jgi:hypothetical protein
VVHVCFDLSHELLFLVIELLVGLFLNIYSLLQVIVLLSVLSVQTVLDHARS